MDPDEGDAEVRRAGILTFRDPGGETGCPGRRIKGNSTAGSLSALSVRNLGFYCSTWFKIKMGASHLGD